MASELENTPTRVRGGMIQFTVYDRCDDDKDIKKVSGGSLLIRDGLNNIRVSVPSNVNSTSYTYNYSYLCGGYSPQKYVDAFYVTNNSMGLPSSSAQIATAVLSLLIDKSTPT